jgi:phage terminase small subunit
MSDKPKKKLTLKQHRFVVAYMGEAKGNATEAARIAGYSGKDHTLSAVGQENLRKPAISQAIENHVKNDPRIASREDILKFWTEMLLDVSAKEAHRFRASENLAKCFAMFIERRKIEGTLKVDDTRDALVKLIKNGAIVDQLEKIESIFLAEKPQELRPTSDDDTGSINA